MKLLKLFGVCLFLVHCASLPEEVVKAPIPYKEEVTLVSPSKDVEKIDIWGLERFLDMTRPPTALGYQEKTFNTCEAGHGFSSSSNCRKMYLVTVHHRLQCRDSEGTISTVDYQVFPIANQSVSWNLGGFEGKTHTDPQGFGQVRVLSTNSLRQKRLRFTLGQNYLGLAAGTVTQIIAPRSWCR